MAFVVAAVKVVAAVVAKSAIAKTVVKLAATAIISKVATKSISKLIAKRDGVGAASGSDAGGRVQLPPATDNKLPIIYGSAWVSGPVIDAKISTDQKYMWYCIALSEKPDSQTISFDTTNGVYYGGKKVNFGTNGAVASLSTNSDPVQTDTRMANKIYIWLFQNGAANAGVNSGGQTAIQIMSDTVTGGGIPANERWNGPIYTSGGQTVKLEDMAFAIVRVEYNPDAGTTSFDSLQVKVTNNMGATYGARPGTAILDYLTNSRYGCDIPLENIDTTSLTNLNTYSNQTIDYVPVGGGTATLPYRYRVNGPLDTGNPCLTNLQFLADTCDSWIQYTETTGKWRVVPNSPYSGTLSSLYDVNDDVLIGGIQINPIDLNDTYNQVEVAYPNTNVKDQTDYQIVDLTDPTTAWYPTFNQVLSPNEAVNRLNIALPLVNEAVQAKYLAVRRLLQSREDLVITCQLDYSGIQIDAGDVIRVNHNAYGWVDKLFRVSTVSEVQDEEGNLSATIEAFEYNGSIYDDNAIQDFIPADNTGLTDPNVIGIPCPPTITNFTDANATVTGFEVTTCVPDTGTVLYMDFNYGSNSNVLTHQLYRTVQEAGGQPFVNSDSANSIYTNVTISVNDLPASTYYWSATARNDTAGRYSNGSNAYVWGGANIQPWNGNSNTGGVSGNQIKSNTIVLRNFASDLNVRESIGGNNFSIAYGTNFANYSLPLLPVYANANTTRNVPLYIPGTSITTNNYYPWYQGTSTTVPGTDGNNYYAANSNGAWTSQGNSQRGAMTLLIADGEDNWYIIATHNFTAGQVAANQSFGTFGTATFMTDTPNTTIQIVQGYKLGNDVYYQCETDTMDTIYLEEANVPYVWARQLVIVSGNGSNISGGAHFVRNLTGNATITTITGGVASSIGPFEFI